MPGRSMENKETTIDDHANDSAVREKVMLDLVRENCTPGPGSAAFRFRFPGFVLGPTARKLATVPFLPPSSEARGESFRSISGWRRCTFLLQSERLVPMRSDIPDWKIWSFQNLTADPKCPIFSKEYVAAAPLYKGGRFSAC